MSRASEALRASRDLSVAVDSFDRAMAREHHEDGLLTQVTEEFGDDWSGFVRETFARLANGDRVERLPSGPSTEWSDKLHEIVDRLDEWRSLMDRVDNDSTLAAIGADALASGIPHELRRMVDPTPDVEAAEELPEPLASEARERLKEAFVQHVEAAKSIDKNAERTRLQLRLAAREAREKVEAVAEAARGLFGGTGAANPALVREAAKAAALNGALREILRMAGRLRANMRASLGATRKSGRGETVGVELGGDLERLVPQELSLLADGGLRAAQVYGRLLDQGALQYEQEHDDRAPSDQGPLLFVVDESGSMAGTRTTIARASMLAMMDAAAAQRRAFGVVKFSTTVESHWFEQPWEASERMRALATFDVFLYGGTNIGAALDEAARVIERGSASAKKADVVLFTDAQNSEVRGAEHRLTSEKVARLFVVLVGADALSGLPLLSGATATTHAASLHEGQISAALDFAAKEK